MLANKTNSTARIITMLSYGSFFSGIDAPLYALRGRVSARFACEIDKLCCQTLRANYDIERVYEGDVTKINVATLPNVDVFTAGFPCQPYSHAGRQLHEKDERAGGWIVCCQYIETHRPAFVLLENVPAFRKSEGGETLQALKARIAGAGYAYVNEHVLDAHDYGSCQRRRRLFIVALRDVHEFSVPAHAGTCQLFHEVLDKEWLPTHKEISVARHAYLERRRKVRHVPEPHHVDTAHVAPTLCASHCHNTWAHMVRGRDGRVRELSPRESLRLMGFGDDFRIVVSRVHAIRQAGNSIVVQMARALLTAMIGVGGGSLLDQVRHSFPKCKLCIVAECGRDHASALARLEPMLCMGTSSTLAPFNAGADAMLFVDWTKLDAQEHLCGLPRECVCIILDDRHHPFNVDASLSKVGRVAGGCLLVTNDGANVVPIHHV